MGSVEGGDLVLTCRAHPRPSGFRPRIGVRGRLFAGRTTREVIFVPMTYGRPARQVHETWNAGTLKAA